VRWPINIVVEWDETAGVARTVAILGEVEQVMRTFPLDENSAICAIRTVLDDVSDDFNGVEL